MCRATIRYGNDVYTYSMCGGVFIAGLMAGDGKKLPEIIVGLVSSYTSFLSSNTLSVPAYEVNVSQLVHFFIAHQ